MTGAEYIAEFLHRKKLNNIFLVTGGAIAFVVDAIGIKNKAKYFCFNHEQSAAMAADSVWRATNGKDIGVCMATSGPGAVNLLSGLGCSYVDSIPSIAITGQVNSIESLKYGNYKDLRQAGYQEIDIVKMSKNVTKFSVKIESAFELKYNLEKAYQIATSGRKGPVLIDVPMNIQQEEVGNFENFNLNYQKESSELFSFKELNLLKNFFLNTKRPLILVGAGVGLSGKSAEMINWINKKKLPFVSTWSAFSSFDHFNKNYFGHIGIYGNRGSNFIVQNCDSLLVLGSRLENRVRSSNPINFAPEAKKLVIDVDNNELLKYHDSNYLTLNKDLCDVAMKLAKIRVPKIDKTWLNYLYSVKKDFFNKDISTFAKKNKSMSPYKVIMEINKKIKNTDIITSDCGAHLCWLYQVFKRKKQTIFTAAGFGPIGYSIPAAIGAAISSKKKVIAVCGDGSFQVQLSELILIKKLKLKINFIILNDFGYGIVKQFQDSYMNKRYHAADIKKGYNIPDFKKIANAYNLKYIKIKNYKDLNKLNISNKPSLIEVFIKKNTLIEPKMGFGGLINDQFPSMSDEDFLRYNKFVFFKRREIKKISKNSKAQNHE